MTAYKDSFGNVYEHVEGTWCITSSNTHMNVETEKYEDDVIEIPFYVMEALIDSGVLTEI